MGLLLQVQECSIAESHLVLVRKERLPGHSLGDWDVAEAGPGVAVVADGVAASVAADAVDLVVDDAVGFVVDVAAAVAVAAGEV